MCLASVLGLCCLSDVAQEFPDNTLHMLMELSEEQEPGLTARFNAD